MVPEGRVEPERLPKSLKYYDFLLSLEREEGRAAAVGPARPAGSRAVLAFEFLLQLTRPMRELNRAANAEPASDVGSRRPASSIFGEAGPD